MEGCCTKAFIHQIIEKIKLECSNSHDLVDFSFVSFYPFCDMDGSRNGQPYQNYCWSNYTNYNYHPNELEHPL
jgi:hypothetical protein